MSVILGFVIFTFFSLSGLILFLWKNIPKFPLMLLVALGAGSMLSVSITHILPETLESIGERAVYAFLSGFLFLYVLEEILTPHKHDSKHEDHIHEDPHEHTNHVTIVAWSGIFLHTILDGVAIAAGFGMSNELGFAVLLGIMIHQIPVSLGLAGILRQSKLQIPLQIILMILFGIAALIGYLISLGLFGYFDTLYMTLAGAFAGGSLLYIATTDLIPMIHGQTKQKYSMLGAFLFGSLMMIFSHELHIHEPHDEHTHIEEIHHQE